MKKGLIIVESPTKAKTIGEILGKEYRVIATMGHIRDLPENEMGVKIEKNFEPRYVLIPGKRAIIANLKKTAGEHNEVYLATDEDREGEAIAWHITYAIGKKPDEVKRVAFHEIVPEAVRDAFNSPRNISMDLVDAQQARRILDRLVGYTLSPLLGRGLSAGRVQSVALKLIVEREKEIEDFVPQVYWTVKAEAEKKGKTILFTLTDIERKKIEKYGLKEVKTVDEILDKLHNGRLTVTEKTEKIKQVSPYPPFITSTLQQYMRTDSPSVAKPARTQAIQYIKEIFGNAYLPAKPHLYKSKSASAQEAHEAIRPTSILRTPEKTKSSLNEQQYKLYKLIWERFLDKN